MKRCCRCLLDETIPGITFDENGQCNYCKIHDEMDAEYPTDSRGEEYLKNLIQEIKEAGKNSKYDCAVGVSGGCDSSFLLYKMKEYGLRPLAVHFDNTWNSTTSTENIKNITKKLDVDLYTYVVDNKEYDDIYRSFFKAGVADVEAPTDIGLATVLYLACEKYKIKYIIEGHSFRTEGISPLGWLYMDGKYIQTVQKTYGTAKLKTYPNLWLSKWMKWMIIDKVKKVRPLYYMDYKKEETKKFLTEELGWKWYGGHHLENRFTAFFHSYLMPVRFGIDHRLIELSALIRSGQITREQALEEIKEPPYLEDGIVELVKKRLGFSEEEFTMLMNLPKKSYKDYKTYKHTFERMRPFFWLLYKTNFVPKSFYIKFTKK